MRYFILFLLCFTCFSASAQWWRIGPLKHKRYPQIALLKSTAIKKIPAPGIAQPAINGFVIPSYYDLQQAEKVVMKNMKHNMRYRIYKTASYDFSELAQIYIRQNRLSEAKWFLLQSNLLARRQHDYQHIYANLMSLAGIKLDMGDVNLARQDLMEARAIANAQGWVLASKEADKQITAIQGVHTLAPKPGLKYAETAGLVTKSK